LPEENSIKNIDFLKIDIEGMEIDCLRGGEGNNQFNM
jgi:FkbM family methyltransferase